MRKFTVVLFTRVYCDISQNINIFSMMLNFLVVFYKTTYYHCHSVVSQTIVLNFFFLETFSSFKDVAGKTLN